MAKEAKRLAEEMRKEKQAEQWAGIPHDQLLNQSFLDQLNSIQALEILSWLHLTKEHLPDDIIDILERLGKADNIPFNQLYSIAENCADRYYSKVIKTFTALIKRQFADRQILLVNTAHSLKFLEDYVDRQTQLWQVLQKYQESERTCQEYSTTLQNLDDNQYYTNINQAPQLQYSSPVAPYDWLSHHKPSSTPPQATLRSTEELRQLFGKGRGKVRCEKIHSHCPFGSKTHSLQCKIKKN